MAGMDYIKCGICSKRMIYDDDQCIELSLQANNIKSITCDHCVKKLKKKIELLKKHDRRRH